MKRLLLMAAAAVFFSGCLKTDEIEQGCNYDECALKAPAAEIEMVRTYLVQNNITATEHCSGLFYAIDSVGTGVSPNACSDVTFRYKGMLTNGTVFDSSNTTTQPYPLSGLVRGWVNGLPKIKTGGGMRLYIPPTLGYGSQDRTDNNGNVVIPADSVLIFEMKLDGVRLR